MLPKVSVIVPVFKVESFIERCARSLFEQTLDHLEYIFVNDCTPDRSMKILHEVLDQYPLRRKQVKIINFPQNMGAAKAREEGIKVATGEYIIHCDSDDWVDTDMYGVMYEKAAEERLDMLICDWIETDGITHKIIYQDLTDVAKPTLIKGLINRSLSGSLCNKLIAGSIYRSDNLIHPQAHMMEDVAYSMQLLYRCKKIGYISRPFYYYFDNKNSICKNPEPSSCINRCKQACQNIDLVLAFLREKKIETNYKKEIVVLKNSARVFLWPLLTDDFAKYYQLWISIYPEINYKYPFTKGINPQLRLIFLLTVIRLYPFIKKFMHKYYDME